MTKENSNSGGGKGRCKSLIINDPTHLLTCDSGEFNNDGLVDFQTRTMPKPEISQNEVDVLIDYIIRLSQEP